LPRFAITVHTSLRSPAIVLLSPLLKSVEHGLRQQMFPAAVLPVEPV
jgi:hypothetical protein